MNSVQTPAVSTINPAFTAAAGQTLTFKRRHWVTGTGDQLIYEHANGAGKTDHVFLSEAEADQFAKDNACSVTHRVVMSDAEMRKADQAASITFRANKNSYGASRRRYSNCY